MFIFPQYYLNGAYPNWGGEKDDSGKQSFDNRKALAGRKQA
jgi:hypothetical protein